MIAAALVQHRVEDATRELVKELETIQAQHGVGTWRTGDEWYRSVLAALYTATEAYEDEEEDDDE